MKQVCKVKSANFGKVSRQTYKRVCRLDRKGNRLDIAELHQIPADKLWKVSLQTCKKKSPAWCKCYLAHCQICLRHTQSPRGKLSTKEIFLPKIEFNDVLVVRRIKAGNEAVFINQARVEPSTRGWAYSTPHPRVGSGEPTPLLARLLFWKI